jgi:hypothetical protein
MSEFLEISLSNLFSPMVLFFALGFAAQILKSSLEVPEAVGRGLSIYLMLAIGFTGGVELSHNAQAELVLAVALAAVALSLALPFLAYALLRSTTRLDIPAAAAVAAHYGSVSVVTFVTATAFLTQRGEFFEGYLVAMLALMETPAIVSGLLLARRDKTGASRKNNGMLSRGVLHEVLLSGSVLLLIGSFIIGWASGERGMEALGAFVKEPFQGILSLFLLDLGLLAARRLSDFRAVGPALVAFGLYMPLVGASLGLITGWILGLSVGGITLLGVLAASASYIVVPAAMRLALPQANPSIYVPLSLGVTFPFNVIVGIPLYYYVAVWLAAQ